MTTDILFFFQFSNLSVLLSNDSRSKEFNQNFDILERWRVLQTFKLNGAQIQNKQSWIIQMHESNLRPIMHSRIGMVVFTTLLSVQL